MLGPASRCVAPAFQQSRRHQVGFVRDLVKAGSVGFVEGAVEHVGLFFFAKKAGAQWFVVDARVSNRRSLRPPPGPLLTGEGLCHVEFQGAPEDAQNWLVGSADIENAFHQMGIPWWLQAFFALPAVLASEVGYTGKTIDRRRRAPDPLIYPVPATLPMVVLGRCFSVRMSQTTVRSQEVLILLFSSVVTTPHHCCLVANMARDPMASVGRVLTIFGFWLMAQTALTFISHVSLQVYRKPVSFAKHALPA